MIIVTGANGFIGSAMVWELNQAKFFDIICADPIDLKQRPSLLAKKKILQFLNHETLIKDLESGQYNGKIDWIIHMGACSSTTEMNVDFLTKNNVEYSKKLFNWCAEKRVPIIYASSASVYGDGSNGFDDQEDPSAFKPMNPYGRSKSEFDVWAVNQTKTPPFWYGVRFFNVFGPNEYFKGAQSSVVLKAFNEIKETGQLKLFRSHRPDYKDGLQKRDFVYVKDCTNWMLRLMDKKPKSGIYNIGFGLARTWLDLATAVFKNMDKQVDINWIDMPQDIRSHYQYFTEAKMDKLWGQDLNKPKWSLEAGVQDYIKEYLLKGGAIL